ncbi:hypothetical protein PybrP1_006189 [[Pythium] brassicae (nom. inval.)]|nr:hypothetical protein PybrP1_006189 [[Pythium] brassicae (nom. inval.)]
MSWDRDLLDVSPADFQDALRHSPQHKPLAGLLVAPLPPSHGSGSSRVVGFAPPHSRTSMSFQESMDEVEKLLDENVRHRYYDRHAKSPQQIAALQQARAKQQPRAETQLSPTKRTFEFVPLLDPMMLVATAAQDAQVAEEEQEDGHNRESSAGDTRSARGLGSDRNGDDDAENEDDPDAGITTEVKSKYFGAAAKRAYYKTYQELHCKPHLFVDKQTAERGTHASGYTLASPVGTASRPNSLGTPAPPFRKPGVLSSLVAATSERLVDLHDQASDSLAEAQVSQETTVVPPTPSTPSKRRRQALQSPAMNFTRLESSPSLHSPRVLFLSSCIAQSHPAISILIRKDKCRAFDFSHQGLGDKFLVQFAACLPDLPLVEAINVSDNRLSDSALNCLLLALENKPNLAVLDISENEIGALSATSLRNYVASSLCTLKTLTMNNADVDDHECTLFMIAFEKNKSVEHLFLRSNRIGQVVTAKTGAALPTGGESIGAMLNVNLNVATLDLSWNLLKVVSAAPIGTALQLNYNLRELNLSYNACGDEGAMVFGHTLRINSALAKLDLSYNSIGARGAMVIASGLAANKGLRELVLDGNAIGLESGRALMHASCSSRGGASNSTCHLSLFECNLTTSVAAARRNARHGESDAAAKTTKEMTLFNPADPTGAYSLDLSDPYENMIAHELLRIATFKPGFCFTKLEYASSATGGRGAAGTKIELSRRGKKTGAGSESAAQNRSPVALLFAQIDKDASGSVDLAELTLALREYGLGIGEERLACLVHEYDYDRSGSLQEAEFQDLFFRCGFAMVDADQSGSLNADEIATALRFMGFQDISPPNIELMIAHYDLNGSGEIDESEFLEFMKAEAFESDEQQAASGVDEAYESIALREASGTIWKILTTGTLHIEFDKSHDHVLQTGDGDSAHGSRRRSSALSPSQTVSDAGVAKLVSSVQGVSRNNAEQAEFLKAVLADSDLFLTASQAEQLLEKQGELKSTPRKLAALVRILPQMASRREAIALTVRLFDPRQQWHERFALRRQLGNMYSVLLGSLTSRYAFDLTSPDDRAALKKLALIAQEEKLFSKNRSGRGDTSQHGNWENFRHATVDGKMVLLTSTFILNALLAPASSRASRVGKDIDGNQRVEFCYVSTTRPPRGTKALTPRRFEQLLQVLSEPIAGDHGRQHRTPTAARASGHDAREKSRQNALVRWQLVRNSIAGFHTVLRRSAASRPDFFRVQCTVDGVQQKLVQLEMLVCDRWLHSDQAAGLVAAFPNVLRARAHAACIVFGRIVDVENFIRIYDTLSSEDQHECVHRLGWLNMFDPNQPDRQFPPLDLSIHDERELVQVLAQLAGNEGQATWQEPAYYIATGQLGPPTTLLPSEELPPAGWGNVDATGEQSLKHHGLVRVRFQSREIDQGPIQEQAAAGASSSPRMVHVDAETQEFRSQLRLKVLCGTRLFV